MTRGVWVLTLVSTLVAPVVGQQEAENRNAAKVAQIYEAMKDQAAPLGDRAAILIDGLRSGNPDVRKAALNGIAGMLYFLRGSARPDLRPVIEDLTRVTPLIAKEFDSNEEEHRHAAVMAIGNIDAVKTGAVSSQMCTVFRRWLESESSTRVRLEIVKAVGLGGVPDSVACNAIIHDTLADGEPAVVRYAAFGVTRLKLYDELGTVAALLSSGSAEIRLVAAETFVVIGRRGAPYRAQLTAAAGSERDERVWQQLQRAIVAMGKD